MKRSPRTATEIALDKLNVKIPFNTECKLYNHQPLSEEEEKLYRPILDQIAVLEEQRVQETLAVFAQYCKIDHTK